MRELTAHQINDCNKVITVTPGAIGAGGAPVQYHVNTAGRYLDLRFQNGPPAEVGVNGITNEVLLAILIDRFEQFQQGPFKCIENEAAIGALKFALHVVTQRTEERSRRGVEGQHVA